MNNSKYVIPYFVNNLELFYNYILKTDLTISDFGTELNIYLKKCNKYLKSLLLKEPNFSRILFKDGSLCAVFNSPKKYRGIIHSIALCGFNSANKYTLLRLCEMQQKTLAARESSQGLFVV